MQKYLFVARTELFALVHILSFTGLLGQHMYIPVNATAAEDPVRLFAFVGQSGSSFRLVSYCVIYLESS